MTDATTTAAKILSERAVAGHKKHWEPAVGTFLTTSVIGGALTYGAVLTAAQWTAAVTTAGTIGWAALTIFLGINAVGFLLSALSALLNFA